MAKNAYESIRIIEQPLLPRLRHGAILCGVPLHFEADAVYQMGLCRVGGLNLLHLTDELESITVSLYLAQWCQFVALLIFYREL